jgi:hypothetical protein
MTPPVVLAVIHEKPGKSGCRRPLEPPRRLSRLMGCIGRRTMSEQQPQTGRTPQRRASAGSGAGLIAGLAALIALVALGVSLYGLFKQSATAALEIQLPYLIAAGGGMTIAAVIAAFRSMSVWDILEAVWEAVAMLFGLIGAMLKGVWNAILGLFGWD